VALVPCTTYLKNQVLGKSTFDYHEVLCHPCEKSKRLDLRRVVDNVVKSALGGIVNLRDE
jgi:hypothetical protein